MFGLSRSITKLVVGLAVISAFSCQRGYAQAEINLPPTADTRSPTGVSFKTGAFNTSATDLSIGGPGIAGLTLVRSYSSTSTQAFTAGAVSWVNNTTAMIVRNPYTWRPDEEPFPDPTRTPLVYTVMTGTSSSRFKGGTVSSTTPVAGNYGGIQNKGETLFFTKIGTGSTTSGSYFTFTDARGVIYTYPWTSTVPGLSSVVYPDGTTLTYTNSPKRMIVSNRGYALFWESSSKVCAINLAEYYVDVTTTTCPVTAQSVTYTVSGSPLLNLTSVTNAVGATTNYEYLGFNHLACIKDPGQTVCRISNVYSVCPPPDIHTPANRTLDQVVSQLTGTGESYSYAYTYPEDICTQYTGYGVTASMTAPGNAVTQVSTNGAGAINYVTDPLGRGRGYGYDEFLSADPYMAELLSSVSAPEQDAIWASRDNRGNVLAKQTSAKPGSGLADLVETASYPTTSCASRKTCNKPDYIIDAKGNRTDFTYDPNHGGILTETRPAAPNGVRPQKRYTYTQLYAWIKNSSGGFVQASSPVWMLTSTSECMTLASCTGTADEIKTTYTYGTSGTANNLLPTAVTIAAGDGSVSATTTTTYDSAGNPILIDGPLPGSADTTRTRYDALRRVVGVVTPDPDGAGPLPHRAVRNTYDPSGELIKVERGTVNSQSDTDWAAFVSLESVDTTYDLMGRKLRETKSGGGTVYAVTQYKYDGSGRLQCTAVRMDPSQWNSQTDACVPQTTGPFGPDRIAKNTYNAANERTVLTLGYGTSVQADEETSTFTPNGKLWTITDGEGNKTTYAYDGHDRLYRTYFPDPVTRGTSSSIDFEQLLYDSNSNVTAHRLRDGQDIYSTYDNLNRIILKDLSPSETDVSYSSYDLQGHLLSASQYTTVSSTFDALGRQLSESSSLGTMTYDYDEAGRRTKTTWPNGAYVTQDFFGTGEVQHIYESGVALLAQYSLDSRGNRTNTYLGDSSTDIYTFDAISRLRTLSIDMSGTSTDSTTTLTYNPASQIATYTRSNDSYAWQGHYNKNDSYAVNGLNQATTAGSQTVGYDGRGNLTAAGSSSYSYSSENLLTTGNGATLQYDFLGRLSQFTAGGQTTRYQYDGTDLVAEYDGANNLLRRYVHGPGADEPVVWYEGAGTGVRRYIHRDERGSTVAITFGSNLFAINTYDEYGMPGATNVGTFQYTGQVWASSLGLYYYKARMYSPTLGRFMQTDPIGYSAGINWYAFVNGDPVNKSDSTGLDPGDAFMSPEAAAADALAYINPTSVAQNVEYGGYIYRRDGAWFASSPVTQGRGAQVKITVPKKDTAGDYHTHGDYSRKGVSGTPIRDTKAHDQYGSDNFSTNDKQNSSSLKSATGNNGWKSYLGTPSGDFKQYTPATGKTEKLTVPMIPAEPPSEWCGQRACPGN